MAVALQDENVGGVVCCTEPFELKAAYTAMREEDWASRGIRFHNVSQVYVPARAVNAEEIYRILKKRRF